MSGKGMSFLNKKSWHTGGMRMIEKVWLAEEKAKQEQAVIAQLKKELTEERKIEEVRALQAAQGLVTKTPVNRLEWMYAGQSSSSYQQQKQEEYLLGAAVKQEVNSNIAAASTQALTRQGDDKQVWALKKERKEENTAVLHPLVLSELEQETRLREDPLMQIMREQQKQKQQILNNPIKMRHLKQQQQTHSHSQTQQQRHTESNTRELKKNGNREDRHKRKKEKKQKKKKRRRSESRSRSRSSSRSPSPERLRHKHREPESNNTDITSPATSHPASIASVPSSSTSSSNSSSRMKSRWDQTLPSSSISIAALPPQLSTLPSIESPLSSLISARASASLSTADRDRRLLEMQRDAAEHAAMVHAQISAVDAQKISEEKQYQGRHQQHAASHADNDDDDDDADDHQSAPFLQSLNKQAYLHNTETLAERVQKQQHYRQKGTIEEQSFL